MGYDITRYLNIRSARSPSVGPNGEEIAFLMDTTGVPQVWTVDGPGRWPTQRTFYEERVSFAEWSPTRRELVFGMDEGGNERMQLYRLDAETGAIDPLTDHPAAKHRWGGWDSNGDRFAFASNRRDESVFDIYVQSRTEQGDEATRVYEGDGWLSVAGWSPDDSRLLVHEARASFDHDLYVLDLETGTLEQLTTAEGEYRYQSPEWGPEGESIYVATDEGADTMYLGRLSASTGELEVVTDGGDWNVTGITVHEDTGRVVYSRNVDGYTELTVGRLTADGTVEVLSQPTLPDGLAGGTAFFPDGDRLAVSASSRTTNSNVYVVDATSGATERYTTAPTAGIPEETFTAPELIHYETFDGREIPAFVTLPAGDKPAPIIVDIHGGPESQRRPYFSGTRQYFLDNGYGLFEPNVRGSSGYGRTYTHLDDVENRMDSVRDIKAGVEWLHDHPRVDPDRIAVMGGSYGGFMVLASMTEYPDLWAAGVDIVGIANFVTFLENTGPWRRSLREAEYGSLEEDREFLESVSPIHKVDQIDAPLCVIHGENDPRVPVGEARQIVAELEERSVPVRKLIFEDEGHGIVKLENKIVTYTEVADFFDEYV